MNTPLHTYQQLALLHLNILFFIRVVAWHLAFHWYLDILEDVDSDTEAVRVFILCETKLARLVVGIRSTYPASQIPCTA
jgi:hypothetical protein